MDRQPISGNDPPTLEHGILALKPTREHDYQMHVCWICGKVVLVDMLDPGDGIIPCDCGWLVCQACYNAHRAACDV